MVRCKFLFLEISVKSEIKFDQIQANIQLAIVETLIDCSPGICVPPISFGWYAMFVYGTLVHKFVKQEQLLWLHTSSLHKYTNYQKQQTWRWRQKIFFKFAKYSLFQMCTTAQGHAERRKPWGTLIHNLYCSVQQTRMPEAFCTRSSFLC